MHRPIITLTTDFGIDSAYVAQMKGVILGICPDATIIDITHAVPPQNIMAGAIVLRDTAPHFPPGTIHIAVVDPGVGTERRIIYVEVGTQRFIAPDNGLLSQVTAAHGAQRIIAITNKAIWRDTVSHTFHGRDVMALVAAHLAMGLDPTELGPHTPTMLEPLLPQPCRSENKIYGCVTHVDSFGNAVTNIPQALLDAAGTTRDQCQVKIAERIVRGISATYGERPPGQVTALIGSSCYLEVAIVNGSAAAALHLLGGEEVVVDLDSAGT